MGFYKITNSGFLEIDTTGTYGSINSVSVLLGYEIFQIHTAHHLSKKFDAIAFEIFTSKPVFILSDKKPTFRDFKIAMRKFKFKEEYDSIYIRDFLLEGIANKNLHLDYLSSIFNFSANDPNGEYYAKKIGVKLFFINNTLASFKLDNDLEEWGRYFKNINKDLIVLYAKLAKKYWDNDYDGIFKEVNSQSEALANTPKGFDNEYISLHKGEFGTVNFYMLLVCHYGYSISEEQFQILNYGRYEKKSEKEYKLGKATYRFDNEGNLMKIDI